MLKQTAWDDLVKSYGGLDRFQSQKIDKYIIAVQKWTSQNNLKELFCQYWRHPHNEQSHQKISSV